MHASFSGGDCCCLGNGTYTCGVGTCTGGVGKASMSGMLSKCQSQTCCDGHCQVSGNVPRFGSSAERTVAMYTGVRSQTFRLFQRLLQCGKK